MTAVLVVRPDVEDGGAWVGVTEVELAAGDAESLRFLQETVGGYLEVVRVAYSSRPLWLFCNEDGQRLGLPFNALASALARQSISGPVVFHGGADAAGELLPCPEWFRESVMRVVSAMGHPKS